MYTVNLTVIVNQQFKFSTTVPENIRTRKMQCHFFFLFFSLSSALAAAAAASSAS
jgi:hypothetical protein